MAISNNLGFTTERIEKCVADFFKGFNVTVFLERNHTTMEFYLYAKINKTRWNSNNYSDFYNNGLVKFNIPFKHEGSLESHLTNRIIMELHIVSTGYIDEQIEHLKEKINELCDPKTAIKSLNICTEFNDYEELVFGAQKSLRTRFMERRNVA